MTDPIQEALDRANAAATANNPPAVSQQGYVQQAPQNVPAARPRSLDDAIATAGMSVSDYIGVKEGSFTVNKSKSKAETIKVTIKLSEVKPGFGVRFMSGGRPTYAKSYNGVTEARGKSWAVVLADAQNIDPACKGSYDLADIPMTLREKVDGTGKDASSLTAGTRVGYTTPVTGYAPFMAWVNSAIKEFGVEADIPVVLSLQVKNGPTGEYSIMGFDTDRG